MKLRRFNEEWISPEYDKNKGIVDSRLKEIESRDAFISAMETLLYIWTVTPRDAYITANEFLSYYEISHGVKLPRFDGKIQDDDVFDAIRRTI